MIVIVGAIVVIGAVLGGFSMAGGHIGALIHPSELVTIGGAALIVGWWTCPYLVKLLPVGNRVRRQVETELAPFWRDSWLLLRVVCVSLVFHLSQVCVQWVLGKATGVSIPLSYCLVFHPIMSVATALPVSIGGFGVREGGYVLLLGRIGIKPADAVALSLLWFGVTAVAGLVGGLVFTTYRRRAAAPPA